MNIWSEMKIKCVAYEHAEDTPASNSRWKSVERNGRMYLMVLKIYRGLRQEKGDVMNINCSDSIL